MGLQMQKAECQIRRTLSAEAREVETFGQTARDGKQYTEKNIINGKMKMFCHKFDFWIFEFLI